MHRLLAECAARVVDFDQCRHGAEAVKPTRVVYVLGGFETLRARCNHQERHQRVIGVRRANGEWATKALERHPAILNRNLGAALAVAWPTRQWD